MSITGYALKTADQSRTSTTALADDNTLVFSPSASTAYRITCVFRWSAGATPDFKFAFSVSSGTPTAFLGMIHGSTTNEDMSALAIAGSSLQIAVGGLGLARNCNGNNTAGFFGMIMFRGLLKTDSSPGNFALQWAQITSSGTAATVYAGSFMTWEIIT